MTDTLAQPAKRYGLTFSTNGIERYALEFTHETGVWPQPEWVKSTTLSGIIRRHRTAADLIYCYDDGSTSLYATGQSYCAPCDTFDREIGRQVALFDLLRNLPSEDGPAPAHIGQRVLRTYCTRPGALPWVLDRRGRIDYAQLRGARLVRAMLRRDR